MHFATLNLCNLGADAAAWRLAHFGRLIAQTLAAPALLALQEIKSAMDAVKQAQQSGNFGDYGQALQRLNDAMTKYDNAG